jgi:hypothetical protein
MKTAIYIEDGIVQLVLTPEDDNQFERNALAMFADKPLDVKIHNGQFYDCQGGWTRQKEINLAHFSREQAADNSLILRIEPAKQLPKAVERMQ